MNTKKTPSFIEYICQLPHDLVFSGLVQEASVGRRIVSTATSRNCALEHAKPEAIKQRFAALTPDHKLTLARVYLFGATGIVMTNPAGFNDPLLSSFLAYAARDNSGKLYYCGFDDLYADLKPLLGEFLVSSVKPPSSDAVQYSPWFCMNDLVVLTTLIAQGDVRYTRTGGFNRTARDSFKKRAHGYPATLKPGGREVLDLMVDVLTHLGVVIIRHDELMVVPGQLATLFEESIDSLHTRICSLIDSLSGELRTEICVSVLAKTKKAIPFSVLSAPEQEYCAHDCVAALVYTGRASISPTEPFLLGHVEPADTFLQTRDARPMILPDFSALIPMETAPKRLFWFSRIGTIVSFDNIYKGKIDRSVVNNSLCSGVSAEVLCTVLDEWSAPPNVAATVREWIREFSRVSVVTGGVLVSSEAAVSNAIDKHPPLARCLAPLSADRVWAIHKGSEERVRELLVKLGYDPRVPGQQTVSSANDHEPELMQPSREPIVDFEVQPDASALRKPSGKYSNELKKLDATDTFHVLDYAILMGYQISIDYQGSPGMRRDIYTIIPSSYVKGNEPAISGTLAASSTLKTFPLKKIDRIGVVYS